MKFANLLCATAPLLVAGLCFSQPAPMSAAEFTLSNDQVIFSCKTKGDILLPDWLKDKTTGEAIGLGTEMFSLLLTNGDSIHSADFRLASPVHTELLTANLGASRYSERLPGKQLTAEMASMDGNLHVTWHGILRNGSRYLRQQFIFEAGKTDVPVSGISLLEAPVAGAHSTGKVDGTPVMTDT